MRDATASRGQLVVTAVILALFAFDAAILYRAIWRTPVIGRSILPFGSWWAALALLIFGVFLHEFLHVLGWIVAGKVPWRRVSLFGTLRYGGAIMVHLEGRITARAYRISGVLPAVVLGFLPLSIGLLIGNRLLAFWGIVFLLTTCGDLAALWALRGTSGSAEVADHPKKLGCEVYSA